MALTVLGCLGWYGSVGCAAESPPIPRHRSPPFDQRWAFSSPSAVEYQGRPVARHATQRIAWTDDVHGPGIAPR
eukprot:5067745-Pyramimonas_sp.AAC.1